MTTTNGLQLRPIDVLFDSSSTELQFGDADYPKYILQPALTDIVGYTLLSVNVPFTYYVIDDTCNTFTWTDAGVTGQLITIPPGTYNAITLTEVLTSLFSAGSPYATAGGNVVYTWYVNPDTNKLCVFAPTGASQFTMTMTSQALSDTLGIVMGANVSSSSSISFRDDTYVPQTGFLLQGDKIINLQGPNQMLLHGSLSNQAYGSVRTQNNYNDLIGFIPVLTNYGGYIQFSVQQPQMVPVTKCNLTEASFYLTVGSRSQYSLYASSLTAQNVAVQAATSTVNYLPLQGENWQLVIRFF